MENNVYIKRKLVYDNELSEIDFDLYKEFGFDSDKHEDCLIVGDSRGYADAYPIKIEKVIQELVNMKEAGSTHVEIGYHCDHIGYIFEGYNISKMSNDEVNKLLEEKRAKKTKQDQIAALKKQIQILENSQYGATPKRDEKN